MTQEVRYVAIPVLLLLIQVTPKPAMAYVEGLSWGMDLTSLERHLGVFLIPVQEDLNRGLFEIRDFQMSG